jgi:hypothetical protein
VTIAGHHEKEERMVGFYGRDAAEARRRVGSTAQLARIESLVEAEGRARGARRLRVITGGGLEIELHPDRALDIGQVTIDGIPISWIESDGVPAPWSYDPHGAGWLRTFGGGFLTTCGLEAFGPPTVDEGVPFGQHGRVSAVPARMVRSDLVDDVLVVEAEIRQSSVFAENLLLRRRIEVPAGGTSITVHDVVRNEGATATPHMMMYHANLGWPLVDEGAELHVGSSEVTPRDDASRQGLEHWGRIEAPRADRAEEVFVHSFGPEVTTTTATLENRRLGLALDVAFDTAQLPWLCQWKLLRDHTYVIGIEPVNSPTTRGRAGAREEGTLPILQPGESVSYRVDVALRRL